MKWKETWSSFWRYRYLLYNLVSRDFKLKYRRSVLGVVWSVLNPLMMCFVYWIIFSSLFATTLRTDNIPNFPVYLMIGQLLFNFFSESTSNGMGSVLYAAPLMKKVYIPKYIFPLEKCCFGLINCCLSFVALFMVMLFTGCPIHPTIIFSLYPLFTLFLFTLGVSLALSAMAVFFRDVMHLWTVFTTALTYFSAVFYDPTQMGTVHGISVQALIGLNPIYWYITGFRRTVLNGELLSFNVIWVCGVCALLSLAVGSFIFNKTQDQFVLHI